MCNATHQAPFGQGRNPHEHVMHHCTLSKGHGGSHVDQHTGHTW